MFKWMCVVEADQVYRRLRDEVLLEVIAVHPATEGIDAFVQLRPVDVRGHRNDQATIRASILCGPAYERLPDEDCDTVLWGGGTRIGIGRRAE